VQLAHPNFSDASRIKAANWQRKAVARHRIKAAEWPPKAAARHPSFWFRWQKTGAAGACRRICPRTQGGHGSTPPLTQMHLVKKYGKHMSWGAHAVNLLF